MSFKYESQLERLQEHRTIKHFSILERLLERFSTGERVVLYALSIVLAGSALALALGVSNAASVVMPARSGTLTEGVIGPTRFINPLIALSQSDHDLTELVYSGLTRTLPDGSIVPDLASSYDVSADGTTYTFHLRPDATFQDGTPILAADVVFTVQKAKDPDIKSTERADWDGVTVAAPNAHTVVFTLPHAYAPFLENTSLGILPKHLWENVSTEEFPFSPLNTHPIGSGPYRVVSVTNDSTGAAVRYDLAPFNHFTLGEPYLQKITFLFYSNEDALIAAYNAGRVGSIAGISPAGVETLKPRGSLVRVALPRTFGIFFNQSKNPVLADSAVRAALDAAIDKQAIVGSVLDGFGTVLDSPIPPGILDDTAPTTPQSIPVSIASTTPSGDTATAKARAILSAGGWTFDNAAGAWKKKKSLLQLSLSTADEPELAATANAVAAEWRAAGVNVDVHVYPLSELNSSVIRPRQYDAVLFGEVVGRTADLFAFWHSSQRNDPGLNVALYANSKTDALLTQARATNDQNTRKKLYTQFASIIAKDQPAVFLYAPEFLYAVPTRLEGLQLGALTSPSERFATVYQWYTDTEHVWGVFAN